MKRKLLNHRGFTLIEMLVYMGVSAILLVSLTQIFSLVGKLRLESQSSSSLQEDGAYLFSRLGFDISRSVAISIPAENELNLTIGGNTFRYFVDSGRLKLDDSTNEDFVTSKDITISDLKFKKLTGNTYDNVRVSFTLTSDIKRSSSQESRQFITTFGNR